MYDELAILAIMFFLYNIFAGRLEQTVVTGPMIFVALGFLLGPLAFGIYGGDASSNELRFITDLALATVLFSDAANANLRTLKKQYQIPVRMLLLGLPGVMLLGFAAAILLIDDITVLEAAILGTMLAATDAALGKAVISDMTVPSRVREGLNVESGLNDGLCVPVLLVFIALARGDTDNDSDGAIFALTLVAQELGVGLIVGILLAIIGSWLLAHCSIRGWISKARVQMTIVALAIAAFAIAQHFHGSGYIAAFSGGLMFGYLNGRSAAMEVLGTESAGESLAMLTWFIFGAAVVGHGRDVFSLDVVIYAALSLTVIRMLPIFLSLTGSGEKAPVKLFLGWFGPRGLASIVFVMIVVNENVAGAEKLSSVVVTTVVMSLILHGLTAKPFAAWLSRKQ